jgi:hypothetical protein
MRYRLIGLSLALLVVSAGCRADRQDWTLSALSDSDRPLIVRVVVGPDQVDVLVPAGGAGLVTSLPSRFRGSVMIIDPVTCSVREIVSGIPDRGDVVLVFDAHPPASIGRADGSESSSPLARSEACLGG